MSSILSFAFFVFSAGMGAVEEYMFISLQSLPTLTKPCPLAGILRYKVDLQQLADLEDEFNDIDLDDYM